MEDSRIIELFFARDEAAIEETQQAYGTYCRTIADRILESPEDAEECVNDAMLRLWEAIPPQKPARLRLFLGKIVRNLAFDRYKMRKTAKRGGGELNAVLDELAECVADENDVETVLDTRALRRSLSEFTAALPSRDRRLFVGRYFYAKRIGELAKELGIQESSCAVQLCRIRKKLRQHLEQEGFSL